MRVNNCLFIYFVFAEPSGSSAVPCLHSPPLASWPAPPARAPPYARPPPAWPASSAALRCCCCACGALVLQSTRARPPWRES